MTLRVALSMLSTFFAVIVGAHVALAQRPGEMEIRQGVIEQITPVQIQSNHHRGGSLIGGGTGRDVAMVVGALGGAVVGNEIQKKQDQPTAGQQVIVRVKSRVLVAVTQPVDPSLQTAQRGYIEGNGDGARLFRSSARKLSPRRLSSRT